MSNPTFRERKVSTTAFARESVSAIPKRSQLNLKIQHDQSYYYHLSQNHAVHFPKIVLL